MFAEGMNVLIIVNEKMLDCENRWLCYPICEWPYEFELMTNVVYVK